MNYSESCINVSERTGPERDRGENRL